MEIINLNSNGVLTTNNEKSIVLEFNISMLKQIGEFNVRLVLDTDNRLKSKGNTDEYF